MNAPTHQVLIIDDEPSSIDSFELTLAAEGICGTLRCEDSRQAMDMLARDPVDVVLLDLIMPYVGGEALLKQIRAGFPDIEVIVITGIDTVDSAVNCMRQGAFDYLVKPVGDRRLTASVSRALEMRRLKRENSSLREGFLRDDLKRPEAFARIITEDPAMRRIFRYIEAIAPSGQPVLITGESGTGKELVARAVHAVNNPPGPFTPVNMAGLDDIVFSDTLFGHTKGAFTGAESARRGLVESAAGGSLFLDEIGDMSLASQVKLLRLIQEREYLPLGSDIPKPAETRVIAATNRDLKAAMLEECFRADLYYRLNIHHIHLPPLRERSGDISLLIGHFVRKAADTLGRRPPSIPSRAHSLLAAHPFPGNVRELESVIFDAVSKSEGPTLSIGTLKQRITNAAQIAPEAEAPDRVLFPEHLPTLAEVTEQLIDEAMRRSGGKQTVACRLLGISQPALSKRLKRLAHG